MPFSDDFQLRKLECETLIKKYDMLRSELRLHMSRYFDIGKQAQFVVWGVFGAYAFIAKEPTILPKHDNWYIWYFGAILLILTLNYMVMNISESRYAIMHIVARLQMIEMKVNNLIGHSVLEWESTLAEPFWNTWRPFPQIVNPGAFTGLYGAALFMAGSVVMPNYIGILLFNVVPRDWAYLTLLCAIPVLSFAACGFTVWIFGSHLMKTRNVIFDAMLSIPHKDCEVILLHSPNRRLARVNPLRWQPI